MRLNNYRYLLIASLVTLFFVGSFGLVILPVRAADGFIICGAGTTGPADCTFDKLLKLVKMVLDFIALYVVVPVATLVIIYSGFMTLNESRQGKDATVYKKMLGNVLIGMVLALGSYVIVKSLLLLLIDPKSTFFTVVTRFLGN
ncbi:MAG: hypothetical protein NTV48_02110 [Candidatus Vogelbacteria bacterium]|nr:hypothetical protein [Candidatus Vogelbacteria bacterium]